MKNTFFTLILCLFFALTTAQTPPPPAPDFTITTSDGVQRTLYADYLHKGKAVVIDIFFTTCPICISMAPLLEPFYYEWGSGQGPVEFISLSTRANDSNEDVKQYKSTHGHRFLGAGNDGGSLTALQPYLNGSYGFFLGTPTFVVIAPNGTVTYNPRGDSFQATVDSIEQVLHRIGLIKPAVPFNLTGSIQTPDNSKIANVEVKTSKNNSATIFTNAMGTFEFVAELVARDTYQLQLEKDNDPTNGVTTFDLVKVQRHILSLEPFTSPYQLLAADVDRSGTISVADVIQLRRLILRIDAKLTKSKSWLFLNGNYTFNDPQNPFPEVYTGTAASFPFVPRRKEIEPFSIIAIKIGDVNFSAE